MFNAPRSAANQRYLSGADAFGSSFVEDNPLAGSVYDSVDPWSAAPSPSPPPIPPQPASLFNSVIADAAVPAIYHRAFSLVDPESSGETSVNSLSRVLGTSSLAAGTIDKIVNLVSSKPRVSRLEFFVALALVALAQAGKDVSIEQVAALSSQNTLPEPKLDLDSMPPSASAFSSRQSTGIPARSPAPQYSTDDPWSTSRSPAMSAQAPAASSISVPTKPSYPNINIGGPANSTSGWTNGAPSSLSGNGLPNEWWRKQESVKVTLLGQQGFILNRYMVYQVATERGEPVARRYSEFVYLWECLTRRYPFRLFPALPPKRVGPDEHFLEQRRRGLTRALNFVINHPVIKDDGVLASFLTESSFEAWRKNTAVSLEEESSSKRVDRVEEMSIPSDLEDKLFTIRGRVNVQIELWQRICILAERLIKRQEAAAVRIPPAFRRSYLPTHFALPLFSAPGQPSITTTFSPSPLSSNSNSNGHTNSNTNGLLPASDTASTIGGHSITSSVVFGHAHAHAHGSHSALAVGSVQSDLSRLTNTLRAVAEATEQPWRSVVDELGQGVRQGLGSIAAHTQRQSELSELRSRTLLDTTLESLKSQRDLHIAMRDLFVRHEHLSKDSVDRLKKRVETSSARLETIKKAQKDGWQEEVDKVLSSIEKDQAAIAAQLHRRVFIRACLWHELRVVLHNRENTLLTLAVQTFAQEEQEYAESVMNTWGSLVEALEVMPIE